MRNKKAILLFFLFTSSSFLCEDIFSQNKNLIGFSLAADKASSGKIRMAFGASFERSINKRNSVEIGIYYRTAIDDNLKILSPYPPNFAVSEQFFILEKFLSIPLLYNYKPGFINLSIGPTLDIYVGWEEKDHIADPPSAALASLESYKFDNKLLWGAMAKVSKTIKVNNKLLIEPFIYFNPVFTPYSLYSGWASETRQYYGAALTAKYIL